MCSGGDNKIIDNICTSLKHRSWQWRKLNLWIVFHRLGSICVGSSHLLRGDFGFNKICFKFVWFSSLISNKIIKFKIPLCNAITTDPDFRLQLPKGGVQKKWNHFQTGNQSRAFPSFSRFFFLSSVVVKSAQNDERGEKIITQGRSNWHRVVVVGGKRPRITRKQEKLGKSG